MLPHGVVQKRCIYGYYTVFHNISVPVPYTHRPKPTITYGLTVSVGGYKTVPRVGNLSVHHGLATLGLQGPWLHATSARIEHNRRCASLFYRY